jgi:predicted RNase H-like nuclease (RuvC/YqgF family)
VSNITWGDALPVIAGLSLLLGTVITNLRAGSASAQRELINSLKDRIETLEQHIADLEATISELRAELALARKRKK